MSGNSSQRLDFSSRIMPPRLSMWINSEASSLYSRSYRSSRIYSKRRRKNHSSHCPCSSQPYIMLSRWRYSSRQKIWSSIRHWCSLAWVHSEYSTRSGRVSRRIYRQDTYFSDSRDSWRDSPSVWRSRPSCSSSEDSDSSPIDTSHWVGISVFSSYLSRFLRNSDSGQDSMSRLQLIRRSFFKLLYFHEYLDSYELFLEQYFARIISWLSIDGHSRALSFFLDSDLHSPLGLRRTILKRELSA